MEPGMVKLLNPVSDEPPIELIKISSRGLRGNDLNMFIKRAGADLAMQMQKLAFAKDEVPIHLIAIGATEAYGCNRNFDAFDEIECRNHHYTFVKHARFYRNHCNKNPQKSYGIVKWSGYNEPMRRIELVVALNGTKEAAERNKGLLADKELEKLAAKDDSFGVSMATKVAFDVCSNCGHKARTRDEYCTEDTCSLGGLKHHIGKVASNGHILHAKNPNPVFFDISSVFRPADRIAYVLGPLTKAASEGGQELSLDEVDEQTKVALVKAASNSSNSVDFMLTAERVIRQNCII